MPKSLYTHLIVPPADTGMVPAINQALQDKKIRSMQRVHENGDMIYAIDSRDMHALGANKTHIELGENPQRKVRYFFTEVEPGKNDEYERGTWDVVYGSTPYAHFHGGDSNHDDVYLVANRQALVDIRAAIDVALAKGHEQTIVFVNDGEGYSLRIVQVPDDKFDLQARPYTVDYMKDNREEAVWPWDLSQIREQFQQEKQERGQ